MVWDVLCRTTYIEQYYGVKLNFARQETHNYTSAKSHYRKDSISRYGDRP